MNELEKSSEDNLKKPAEKSIEEIAKEAIPQISVLGIGGAGCNIVSWMKDKGVSGAKTYR
jgi:cell division GTPase FtsZ